MTKEQKNISRYIYTRIKTLSVCSQSTISGQTDDENKMTILQTIK